ncbi:TIGR04053 family radical SAM/SPASM domain-containing protein [Haladaptatus sp. NG-SE-30]
MASNASHEEQDGYAPHERDYSKNPLIITWEVTQACELACDHCRADAQPERHPDELTTGEGKELLDQITEFGSPTPILVFSGGDPLERTDLFELLEYAAMNGLRTAVTPAPTSALTESVLDRFVDVGVHRIALSLDGATADRHDAFRGEAGSFETIRHIAEYAADIGLAIQINTTVTAMTVHDLPEITDIVEAFDAVMWEVFFLVPIGRGTALEPLSPPKAEQTLEWLYRRQRSADFRLITVEAPHYRRVARQIEHEERGTDPKVGSTGDGKGFVFVSHTGSVYPSGFLPVEIGNVRDESLVNLYREAPLLRLLRTPDRFNGACGVCPHHERCGGSRARAYATTGDPLASDPLCTIAAQNDPVSIDD